jgi:nucleotide-binding universal stress UspA family protein
VRQVDALEIHSWDALTGEWGYSRLAGPSWPQIEAAIRALDSAARPQVDIILSEQGPLENCLWIQGGNGKYALGGTTGNGRWVQYFDSGTEGYVETPVVTAGEGLKMWEALVCPSTELVVRIARHFVTHNAFLPEVGWQVTQEPEEPPAEEVREVLATLSAGKRVTVSFRGGPLDGVALDSRSAVESERWDVALIITRTHDGRLGECFRVIDRLESQGGVTRTGEYEVRSRSQNAEECRLFLVHNADPGAAPVRGGTAGF